MSSLYTRETARHWEQVGSSNPDIASYTMREDAEKVSGSLGVHNLLLREGKLESCSQEGGCETGLTEEVTDPSFIGSIGRLSQRLFKAADRLKVGMLTQASDLRVAFGYGWQSRGGYLDFSTESSVKSTLQSNLQGTAKVSRDSGFVRAMASPENHFGLQADLAVRELQVALEADLRPYGGTVGGNHGLRGPGSLSLMPILTLAGMRGLFLYPKHGFREWHSNRFDPPGWRMYLIHTERDAQSWFAVKDPQLGTVHHLPDFDGKVNLFRIQREDPVWHSIYSMTDRWSCGVHITDRVAAEIVAQGTAAS